MIVCLLFFSLLCGDGQPDPPIPDQTYHDLLIIDGHAHVFNAEYQPLKRILYRWHLGWPLAGNLTSFIEGLAGTISTDDVTDQNGKMFDTYTDHKNRKVVVSMDLNPAKMEKNLTRKLMSKMSEEQKSTLQSLQKSMDRYVKRKNNEKTGGPHKRKKTDETPPIKLLMKILKKVFNEGADDSNPFIWKLLVLLADEPLLVELMKMESLYTDYFLHHRMDLDHAYGNSGSKLNIQEQLWHSFLFNNKKTNDTLGWYRLMILRFLLSKEGGSYE